jgi:hypothetical protein
MDTLQELEIDELRWPRMFSKLRRAGLYSSCGCAGCGSCQAAARRFVRGVARGARYAGGSPGSRYGASHPVYTRTLGDRRFGLLLNTDDVPAVVDIDVGQPQGEPDADEELWQDVLATRRHWPTSELLQRLKTAIDKAAIDPPLRAAIRARNWLGPIGWMGIEASVPAIPSKMAGARGYAHPNLPLRGLYLVLWEGGAYLGSAYQQERTIRGRLLEHRRGLQRFNKVDRNHRIWWLPLSEKSAEDIRSIEVALLTFISQSVPQAQSQPLAQRFRSAGFTNASLSEL